MPFEFSGAPPAWGSSGSLTPFTRSLAPSTKDASRSSSQQSGDSQTSTNSSQEQSTYRSASPFGSFASPCTRPFSHHSFGTATPSFGSSGFITQLSPSASGSLSTDTSGNPTPLDQVTSDDALSKAVLRAAKKKPAVFGNDNLAADSILQDAISAAEEDISAPTLVNQLREVVTVAPAVASLTRILFDELVRSKKQPEEFPNPTEAGAARNEEEDENSFDRFVVRENRDDFSDDIGYRCEVPGCWKHGASEYFDDIDSWREHFRFAHDDFWQRVGKQSKRRKVKKVRSDQPPAQSQNSDESSSLSCVPRTHPLLTSAVAALSAKVLLDGLVGYREGAKILTAYTVDCLYRDFEVPEIATELASAVDPEMHTDLFEFIIDVRQRMAEVREEYRQLPQDLKSPSSESFRTDQNSKARHTLVDDDGEAEMEPEEVRNEQSERPFRFLDLPAEMRNLVYRELLTPAPGYVSLLAHDYAYRSKAPTYARNTRCQSLILASCKQVHKEAADIMYEENVVMVNAVLWSGNYPIISKQLLPDDVLPKLASVVLVIENNKSSVLNERGDMDTIHWKQLQIMTGLQNIRICIVEANGRPEVEKRWILEHILERIPARCKISFESQEGPEDRFVQKVLDEWEKGATTGNDFIEIEEAVLKRIASQVKVQQGSKSGDPHDYRFPKRGIPQLGQLGGYTSVAAPSIVLGGGMK